MLYVNYTSIKEKIRGKSNLLYYGIYILLNQALNFVSS